MRGHQLSSSGVLHLLVPGRSLYLELTYLVKLLLSVLSALGDLPATTSSMRATVSALRGPACHHLKHEGYS